MHSCFTSVCQEFCPQGGRVSASVHAGLHPPGADTIRSRHTPPGSRHTPQEQTHIPWEQTHTPWEQTSPGSGQPPKQIPPGADTSPGSRLHHTVNERPLRILQECILVWFPKYPATVRIKYIYICTLEEEATNLKSDEHNYFRFPPLNLFEKSE